MIFVYRKVTKNDCLVARGVDFGGEVWERNGPTRKTEGYKGDSVMRENRNVLLL